MSSARLPWWAIGLGSALMLTVFLQWPTVHAIPVWHWEMRVTPLHPLALVATGVVVGGLIALASRLPGRPWVWFTLILLGLASQWGLALSGGGGIQEMRRHALESGHAEFTWTGSRDLNAGEVLRDYERFLDTVPNQTFAKSKPPGQVLAYHGLGRIAKATMAGDRQAQAPLPRVADEAHRQLADFLTLCLPLLAVLALLPFLGICRTLFPSLPWWPPALFALGPSFVLVQMHFDQALYPLVSMVMWWAVVAGARSRRAWAWGILGGLMAGLGTFTSFSLAPAVLLCPFFFRAAQPEGRWLSWPMALSFAGALAAFYAALWLGWDYEPLTRYTNAMAHHAEWKHWDWSLSVVSLSLMNNALEYLWWLGPPSAILFVTGLVSGSRNLRSTSVEPSHVLAWGMIVVLLFVLVLGKTLGEVARLWLFLMPPAFLIAADALRSRVAEKSHWWITWLLWQLLWTIALKFGQDFW